MIPIHDQMQPEPTTENGPEWLPGVDPELQVRLILLEAEVLKIQADRARQHGGPDPTACHDLSPLGR